MAQKSGASAPAPFDRTPAGDLVEIVELASAAGHRARIITLGAALQTLTAPDRAGRFENVVLNYPDIAPYVARPEYFGATMGRYANRIGGAAFTLDGARYELEANERGNILHGGAAGFDKALWRIEEIIEGAEPGVRLSHLSADGDHGFPGNFAAQVTYSLRGDALWIEYAATCDAPTVANMTNHSFFNLAGAAAAAAGRTILDHRLMIAADAITPVDAGLIPTGEMLNVAGTPFDFREPAPIGAGIAAEDDQIARGRGYDHNYALRGGAAATPKLAARVEHAESGRVLELSTTEPGLQFYSGQYLAAGNAATPAVYTRNTGLALEPQLFPDAPNKPQFASATLRPGETYRQVSIYRFFAE